MIKIKILLIISQKANINEIKKIKKVVIDLIKKEYVVYFLNTGKANKEIENILIEFKYNNFVKIGKNYANWQNKEIYYESKQYTFDSIIVLGLSYNDPLTSYLDDFIGSNTQIYIVAQNYGKLSDASFLINEGPYILGSIYDIKKF